ncbi:MAG: hypothetical protein K2Q18_03820 [Bdellovibrionales bacterium]|nr:hypothetical protein [Bdellovibrionales bacterium]
MKTKVAVLALSVGLMTMMSCSSEQKKYDGKELQLTSTGESERPFWTMDGGYKIDKLRDNYNDDEKNPKNAYFVTQASVMKADLVPNCYNMARTRASAEVSEQVSDVVKQAGALAVTNSSTEFNKMIETQSKNMIVGAEMIDKTWFKVEGDETNPYKCFIVLSVPRKNLDKLQQNMMTMLEKEMSGDPGMIKQVRESVEKRMQESF